MFAKQGTGWSKNVILQMFITPFPKDFSVGREQHSRVFFQTESFEQKVINQTAKIAIEF